MKKYFIVIFTLILGFNASSQYLLAGASFGTFNIPGAEMRGFGPTVKLELISDFESMYLDASFYKKSQAESETMITDETGNQLGYAQTKGIYTIYNLQFGFKKLIRKAFDDKGLGFFLGGGAALPIVITTYEYSLPGYNVPDSKYTHAPFSFHFTAGAQYITSKIIIELKGFFDIAVHPLIADEPPFMTGTRLGVLIPINRRSD
jgi:hypothetical protein